MGAHPQKRPKAAATSGEAVGAALKRRYPFHTAKQLAGAIGCTVRTAENILAGHLSSATLTKLIMAFGYELLLDIGASVRGESIVAYSERKADEARVEQDRARQRERDLGEAAQRLRTILTPPVAG